MKKGIESDVRKSDGPAAGKMPTKTRLRRKINRRPWAIAATSEPESFDPADMLQSLLPFCQTERTRAKLDALSDSLRHGDDDVFVIARVGNGIRASEDRTNDKAPALRACF